MPYSLPDPDVETEAAITTKIIRQLKNVTGPAHVAFFLIGEAACFLRELHLVSGEYDKNIVRGVARGRLNEIRFLRPRITLDCDAFWDTLRHMDPADLSTAQVRMLFA